MEILKLLVQVITFLLIISGIPSCSQGWVVANVPLTPQDTLTNTVFTEIVDVDSVTHWYYGNLSTHTNWCYLHNDWEKVEVK